MLLFTVVLAVSLAAAVPSYAAGYTPVSGDAAHGFRQFLIIDKDARIPDLEFTYSIMHGESVPPAAGRMAVIAGVGNPAVQTAKFVQGEAVNQESAPGITLQDGKVYAEKTVHFDFSSVQFTEPGIFRYIVTMTSDGQQAVDYDIQKGSAAEAKRRILDVYVIDDEGELKVDSYAFHEVIVPIPTTDQGGSGSVSAAHVRLMDKSEGFVNYYATQDLEFGKETGGNQGARDKYFEFALSVSGAAPNTTYYADLSAAEPMSGSTSATLQENRNQINPYTFITDDAGSAGVKYYLCDGQYIKVKGIPKDSSYSLTEVREDYISEEGISAAMAREGVAHADPLSGTIEDRDIMTGFTNTRNGIVPTGVMLAAGPASGVIAAGALGVFALCRTGKRKSGKHERA